MKEYYSIDDIAVMTMLSTRTIRNYIKSGFLVGDKPNGNWKFSSENVGLFLENENVKSSIFAKKNGIVYDFLIDNKKREDKVCSIYDCFVKSSKVAEDICKNMLDLVNSDVYEGIKFSYHFEEKNMMVRIIITGKMNQVTELINTFSKRRIKEN